MMGIKVRGGLRVRAGGLGWLAACLCIGLLTTAGAAAFEPKVLDSVVAVVPHWPGQPPRGTSTRDAPEGTAVAVLAGGYLATNAHVLGRALSADIRLNDGRLVAVEIVGRDPRTDLALLKAPMDFPVLQTAPSPPRLGQPVCAVGNQFGLGLSVTCGVVSALNRSNAGFNPVEDFVQTDATVNPGGSGGALVDGAGRLVGLVSAIFTKASDADIGVNFAASMPLVMRTVTDIRDLGRVQVGRSGLIAGPLSPDERRAASGAKVVRLIQNGAALAAGLQVGDIVTRIGDRPVIHPDDVAAGFYLFRPGEAVAVDYVRGGAAARAEVRLKP